MSGYAVPDNPTTSTAMQNPDATDHDGTMSGYAVPANPTYGAANICTQPRNVDTQSGNMRA